MKYKKINNDILKCVSSSELFDLFYREPLNFNEVNLSTLLYQLNKRISLHAFSNHRQEVSKIVALIPGYDFKGRNIATILNVFSKWPIPNDASYKEAIQHLMQLITRKCNENVDFLNAQDIANTVNGLSKWPTKITDPNFAKAIDALVACIPGRAEVFNAQDIANTVSGLSKWPTKITDPDFAKAIDALVVCIPRQATSFNAQAIVNTVNGLSKWPTKITDPDFVKAIDTLVAEIWKIDVCEIMDIDSIVLALCQFDFINPAHSFFNAKEVITFLKKNQATILSQLDYIGAKQFYQINLYKTELLFDELIQAIIKFRPQFKLEQPITSKLQKNIANALRTYFPETLFAEEYFIGFTYVDIACVQEKLIIQVNGPFHYVENQLNLASQLNNHLFKKLGWHVVVIPYFEWDNFATEEAKKGYLLEKLNDYLSINQEMMSEQPKEGLTLDRTLTQRAVQQKKDNVQSQGACKQGNEFVEKAENRARCPKSPAPNFEGGGKYPTQELRVYHRVTPSFWRATAETVCESPHRLVVQYSQSDTNPLSERKKSAATTIKPKKLNIRIHY